ncbi:hypothetical protein BKA62DRAFT_717578 [Auriculariales sp. MPI-PUGE-AT-0066]|nr:hypothetical protein BKA62DRAFT_717578 [Auriculariales sp. MPI-PUGE-AT-0066]
MSGKQLPPELVRDILEIAAREWQHQRQFASAVRLLLISRDVCNWLLPIVYHTLVVQCPGESASTTATFHALKLMSRSPDSTCRRHVRCIVLTNQQHVSTQQENTNDLAANPWYVEAVVVRHPEHYHYLKICNIRSSRIIMMLNCYPRVNFLREGLSLAHRDEWDTSKCTGHWIAIRIFVQAGTIAAQSSHLDIRSWTEKQLCQKTTCLRINLTIWSLNCVPAAVDLVASLLECPNVNLVLKVVAQLGSRAAGQGLVTDETMTQAFVNALRHSSHISTVPSWRSRISMLGERDIDLSAAKLTSDDVADILRSKINIWGPGTSL